MSCKHFCDKCGAEAGVPNSDGKIVYMKEYDLFVHTGNAQELLITREFCNMCARGIIDKYNVLIAPEVTNDQQTN